MVNVNEFITVVKGSVTEVHITLCNFCSTQYIYTNGSKCTVTYSCRNLMIDVAVFTLYFISVLISAAPCRLGSCRISPPCFLAVGRMRRPNQASFVLLYFVLFAFSGLSLVFSVFHSVI